MKRIRVNTRFLATNGVPELITVGMIPFCMVAYFSGWVHGVLDTALCAVVFMLCTWSTGYGEWMSVKGKISGLHFGLIGAALLCLLTLGTKLYSMTEAASTNKLLILAVAMLPCLMVCASYNSVIHKAENFEKKDRERLVALAGYKALCMVAVILLMYAASFWAVYLWGSELSAYLGISRFESWQIAMHNILE